MAESFLLGAEVSADAYDTPPACRSILTVINSRDPAVNNAATRRLARRWRDASMEPQRHDAHTHPSVRTYQSGPELGALHDIIGPYQPKAQFERVYPILQAQIEAAAAAG